MSPQQFGNNEDGVAQKFRKNELGLPQNGGDYGKNCVFKEMQQLRLQPRLQPNMNFARFDCA
jgi:hypothetical protein